VARVHARVTDSRRDFCHKLSTEIIRDSQVMYVEDLCVSGLGRTRLAKSVHDAGWSAFTGMLEYEARLYGREFRRTGRFEPTSQVLLGLRRQGRSQAAEAPHNAARAESPSWPVWSGLPVT
jgi:IS605 OrfB family transposase